MTRTTRWSCRLVRDGRRARRVAPRMVIPGLPDSTLVVFVSRQGPSVGWFERGWDTVVEWMPLEGCGRRAAFDRDGQRHRRVVDRRCSATLTARRWRWRSEPRPESLARCQNSPRAARRRGRRRPYRTLSVAAVARVTTPELLEAVQPGTDGHENDKWLADRSFVEPLADGVALHALVADSVGASLRERDPFGEAAIRRAVADHVYERALAGQFALSADLQHLVVDPEVRWGFSSDIGSRYRIDTVRDGDVEYIGALLDAVGLGAWWARRRCSSANTRSSWGSLGPRRWGRWLLRRRLAGQRAGCRRDRRAARSVAAVRPRCCRPTARCWLARRWT